MNKDTPALDLIVGPYRVYRSQNGRTYAKREDDPHEQGRDVLDDPLILALAESLTAAQSELAAARLELEQIKAKLQSGPQ